MREDFKNSISRLETDVYAAICIEYKNALGGFTPMIEAVNGKRTANFTKEIMIEKSGSINAFFEDLISKKITDLRITNRKKNGSAFKPIGTPYECILSTGDTAVSLEEPTQPRAMQQQNPATNYPAQLPGLNGGGLGGAEIFKIYNHDTIQNQNVEYRNKIENLEKEVKKLEIEVLKNELLGTKSVEKSQANNDLLEKLTPLLAPILQKVMMPSGSIDAGLNAPMLSPVKQQFMAIVNQMDDSFITDISKVAVLMAQNDAFDAKINELVTQFSV